MRSALLVFVPILVALTACASPNQQGLIDTIPDATMTRQELRVRVRELAYELAGNAKASSYELYLNAGDSRTRWAALQVAVRSSEMMVATISHSDPVVSLLDTWALIVQLRNFFETGPAHDIFPADTAGIVAGLEAMEHKIIAIAEDLTTPERVERSRERIEAWALEHPLTARMYRPSITSELVGLLPEQNRSVFAVADTLDDSLARVSTRLEMLNSQLPQQITWHAGMLIENRLGDVDIEALAEQSERVMTMVEEFPQLIDTQREEIFKQVDAQRSDTIQQVEVIRDDTLAEIDRQRMATIASLESAVATTVDRVRDESSLTVGQVEAIATALVNDVNDRVLMTVDRAFRRLLILVGVGLAGAAAIAIWSFRRPPPRLVTEPR